jgi:hypothetical protein
MNKQQINTFSNQVGQQYPTTQGKRVRIKVTGVKVYTTKVK